MPLLCNRRGRSTTIPKRPFFFFRAVQLLSSIVIFGIIGYFIYTLWQDGYRTPYEFSILDLAAAVTVADLLITSILLCCCGLPALPVLLINFLIFLLWIVAFALLLRALGNTTTSTCSTSEWGNSAGVRVCNMFKCLVAFSFLGMLSTFGVVATAVVARKRVPKDFKYAPAANPGNPNTAYVGGGAATLQPPAYGTPPPAQQHGANASYYH